MKDIIYVDEKDNEIGQGSIKKAVDEGIIRRVVRIVLINDKGEVLIQKRSEKVAFPNLWNESTSGHVDVGEAYRQAALREMKEEMGIVDAEIKQVEKFYDHEQGSDEFGIRKSFNAFFVGSYNGEVNIDHDEVSEYKWVELEEFKKWIEEKPEEFTPGSVTGFKIFFKSISSN